MSKSKFQIALSNYKRKALIRQDGVLRRSSHPRIKHQVKSSRDFSLPDSIMLASDWGYLFGISERDAGGEQLRAIARRLRELARFFAELEKEGLL